MGMIGYLKRIPVELLNALLEGTASVEDFLHSDEAGEALDLDKAWHGIHYLLCGDAWEGEGPLFDVLMGGQPINDSEDEEVVVRYLQPEQVQAVAQALKEIGDQELAEGFSPDEMNEAGVYPAPDWNDGGELDYLLGYYGPLKTYYAEAADKGEGMLIYVM
ncbi:YfbM family protein [Saccharibacillus sacchari]|uniref:YfbM family protein n=1 Tax=Saccharibacillus sacchari TaxID=456493 RepID=A0ACC6PAA5_9BACL